MSASAESTIEGRAVAVSPAARWWLPWVAVVVILIANAALRWPLLEMPLERDEGEFAYGGQMLLAGEPPYRSFYAMKWPGIYVAYAAIEVLFGKTTTGIHQGLILATSINIVWMFVIGRRLLDAWGGVWTAAAFAALCYSPGVEPMSTQSQHFVLMFALPAILLLIHSWRSPRIGLWLLAGICFGVGALMKQHGGFLALTGFAGLAAGLVRDRQARTTWLATAVAYAIGLALPLAITAGLLSWSGTFDSFKLWTIDYARAYATNDTFDVGIGRLMRALGIQVPPMWPLLLAAVGGLVLVARRWRSSDFGLLIATWTVASILSTIPGWHFRAHYFFLLWPAVAVLAATSLRWLAYASSTTEAREPPTGARVMIGWAAALALLLLPVATSANYLLTKSHWQLSRTTYGIDPFNECPIVAEYLKSHTTPDDTIAVLGSQPQLYFQSQRRAATGHMYAYPLLEVHPYAQEMQESMIDEIRAAKPKFIVLVQDWIYNPGAPTLILNWISKYLDMHYELRGCVEILSPQDSHFAWDEKAAQYRPQKYCIIQVYRRNDG